MDRGNDRIIIKSFNSGISVGIMEAFGTYTVVLRMAESIIAQSTGLLYSGCPPDQLISRDAVSVARRRRREVDCGNNIYTESCQYDYVMTGNAAVSNASVRLYVSLRQYVSTSVLLRHYAIISPTIAQMCY